MMNELALRLQRLNLRLPERVRTPLRDLLNRYYDRPAATLGVEDWSRPLLGASIGGGDAPDPTQASHPSNSAPPGLSDVNLEHPAAVRPAPRPLRCLLVTGTLDVGGLEEVVVFLARRLPSCGFTTGVLHAAGEASRDGEPQGRLGRMLLSEGIDTRQLTQESGSRFLEFSRPDVISAHGAPSWIHRAASRLSIPCVDTVHMPAFMDEEAPNASEPARQLFAVVAVSDLLRRQYREGNPDFPPGRILTIPNGVDDSRRRPADRDRARGVWGIRDEYVFLCLARHCLQKNTFALVAAFGDLAKRHPDVHLVIAGRPDDRAYVAQIRLMCDSLACRSRIHLRDHHPNPPELFALADGFVLNSLFEGWSLASMEALYSGVPVVLSEVGGAREQVGTDEKRGFVVPNALGDPVLVSWKAMRAVRFSRQANREPLVEAMSSLVRTREQRLAGRHELIEESRGRFRPETCLRKHALVLTAAATSSPLPTQEELDQPLEPAGSAPA